MSTSQTVNIEAQSSSCCPICGEEDQEYVFIVHGSPIVRCPGCGLLSTYPSKRAENYIFNNTYGESLKDQDPSILWTDSITEKEAVLGYINLMVAKGIKEKSKVLVVAPPDHVIFEEGKRMGWEIYHLESPHPIEMTDFVNEFDAAILLYQLEKSNNPAALLQKIYYALKPDGLLMVVTPSLDSTSAKFFKNDWTEWRPENKFYYNRNTAQLMLWRFGFKNIEIRKDQRKYTMDHIYDRAKAFPKSWITRTIKSAYKLFPHHFREIRLRLPSSGMILTAVRGELRDKQLCSIVVPVYNESSTFPSLMEALLEKRMPSNLRREIILVESNSRDGTREQVMGYMGHPDVKVILQEKACGKGNAVRAGFEHADGDIILIQDADLEYDINDIDQLLKPLAKYQVPFVLGSRHGGKWKMREFEGEESLSSFFNFGHFLFTSLINLLYGQHMKDPFTMYKLFRRDCLYGLEFECNRFDFDFELVIKLVLKGYTPIEIPVNYRSRSYKEGKKVRIFRDPLTWLKALIKYRF